GLGAHAARRLGHARRRGRPRALRRTASAARRGPCAACGRGCPRPRRADGTPRCRHGRAAGRRRARRRRPPHRAAGHPSARRARPHVRHRSSPRLTMFFSLPSWAVALIVFGVIGAVTTGGYLTGLYLREHEAKLREPYGVLQGALLGVVGLLLAFGL